MNLNPTKGMTRTLKTLADQQAANAYSTTAIKL
jgi:hypothetical protein